ncbi:MAG: hypothetical protein H6723_16535 [Sandaracinus sp.]|nr:hypothetical protein [Sandaracinus sp.]
MKLGWPSILFGALLGCAGTAVVTLQRGAEAQSYAPHPAATRWQQRCQIVGGYYVTSRERKVALMETVNQRLASAGDEGWELVAVPTPADEVLLCFKRPAP